MARSINEIKEEIIAVKAAIPELEALNSTSAVAIWRAIVYMVAVAIATFETVLDIFKADVEAYATTIPTGTTKWYNAQAKAFQINQNLVWNGTRYVYETENLDSQIVTHAATSERQADGGTILALKVAKGQIGSLAPLEETEKAMFTAYIQKIKFAGTRILVISYNADEISLYFDIYYNPIFNIDEIKDNVKNTISNHLQQLPFDDTLKITTLIDEIQKQQGVSDVIFKNGAAITPAPINITRKYQANAGYMIAINLDNTLNFIPEQ